MFRIVLYRLTLVPALFVLALSVLGSPAKADSEDQNLAREAMLAGKVAPLSELIAVIAKNHEGSVLKAELEGEDVKRWGGSGEGEIWIYEIKLLTPQGKLVKLKYDAKTLEELSSAGLDSLADVPHIEAGEKK